MTTCNDQYLLLMLDASGSIGRKSIENMVGNLSDFVPLFRGNTKIVAITFGMKYIRMRNSGSFNCNVNNRRKKLKQAIKSIRYCGGGTHTRRAVKYVFVINLLLFIVAYPIKR